MKRIIARINSILIMLLCTVAITACSVNNPVDVQTSKPNNSLAQEILNEKIPTPKPELMQKNEEVIESSEQTELNEVTEPDNAEEHEAATEQETASAVSVAQGEAYYDLEHVVLYLDAFGTLPPNYITKKEAQALGWEGGTVEDFQEGAAIGGTYYGNYEGTLPKGCEYHECDLDTHPHKKRGAKRLVYSDDGRYYYTDDHYEHFREVTITDGQVTIN